jgi:3-oxoacyl-[acyl-carrier protein] reductase
MKLEIEGRRAIVCGSSRGLGFGCALALAREGVEVVINGRSDETLAAAAEEIRRATSVSVTPVAADITTPGGRAKLFAACREPDILVNNLSGLPMGNFRDWDEAVWMKALNDIMVTPIMLMRAVVDGMIERRFGRIINITSRAVKAPSAHLALSSSARAGLTAFVATLARQVAKHNVVVNNLLPGPFATEQQAANMRRIAAKAGEPYERFAAARAAEVPAGRFGTVDEFGRLCAYLCSAHASFIVGQNLLIDGGAVNLTL